MQQPDQQASDPQIEAQACPDAPSMQGLNGSTEAPSMQGQQVSPAEVSAMHGQQASSAEAPAMHDQRASPLMTLLEATQHEEITAFIFQEEEMSAEPRIPCTESNPSMQARKDSGPLVTLPEPALHEEEAAASLILQVDKASEPQVRLEAPVMHDQKASPTESPAMQAQQEPAVHEEGTATFVLQDAASSEPRGAIQVPICDEANGGSASSYGRDMGVDRMETQLDGGMHAASEMGPTASNHGGTRLLDVRQGVPEVMVASDHGETRPEVRRGMPELTAASDLGGTRLELRRGAGIPGLLASGPRSTVRLDMRQGSYAALAVSGEDDDYMAFDEPEAGLDARQGMPGAAGEEEEEEDCMACDERADAWPSDEEEVRRTSEVGAELMQGATRSKDLM